MRRLAVLYVLVLGACSSNDGGATPSRAPSTSASETPASASPTPEITLEEPRLPDIVSMEDANGDAIGRVRGAGRVTA